MNKKIKLLAKQAEIDYELRPEIARAPVWIATDDELKQFAELIVRECVNQVELTWMNQNGWSKNDQCVNVIKEHFGVE